MMNQEALFKKIGLILDELNNQYEFLAQNPQQLNELELELFHANANFLADHVQIIKKISLGLSAPLEIAAESNTEFANVQVVETPETTQSAFETDAEQEETVTFVNEVEETAAQEQPDIKIIEEEVFKLDNEPSSFEFILNDHAEHEKFDFEEKSVDEIFNRPLSQEEENILAQKKKLSTPGNDDTLVNEEDDDEIGPEPFLVAKTIEKEENPIVQEDLQPEAAVTDTYKPTLNELLATKPEHQSLANPITDLKQGININDKLLYIKDLFNGYNLAYAEAIDLANKLPNFEAADNFFQKNYAVKNNWAEKQATVDKFYQLLNQRFSL
ncbi:MAG: hypothetical protein V4541_09705 [Bacteroidota bacterium]